MSDEEEIKDEKTDIEKPEENNDDITLTIDSMHKDLSKNTTISDQEYERVEKL